MDSFQSRLDLLLEDLEALENWRERFEFIIDLGRDLDSKSFPETARIPENLVRGCTSQVWLISEKTPEGALHLQADSDALFSKGLISLLLQVYSDLTPQEILDHPPLFLKETGLLDNLTPSRSNGVASMAELIREHARRLLSSESSRNT